MRVRASFREWLSGSYWRLDAPTDERPIRVDLEARTEDLAALVRDHDPTWTLAGTIDAEGLAAGRPLEGTLGFRWAGERRIRYRLAFTGDDGHRYELDGQKEFSKLKPFESVTLLAARLFDDAGEEVARITLRFDLRADWTRWMKNVSAGIGREERGP
jgi:hypothetical protein